MAREFLTLLSSEWVETILALPTVVAAKERMDARSEGSESFSVTLPPTVTTALQLQMGIDLSSLPTIPMRWIKGDTRSHVDTGAGEFAQTYLAYLTDSAGELIVDGHSYPIRKGVGYSFSEGLRHETVGTDSEPRLLLGPMNERGAAVGISSISGAGGTTLYIRDTGTDIEYSADQTTWNTLFWPSLVDNLSPADGILRVVFTTSITITNINQYLIANTEKIQFGSETLLELGQRPVITITDVANYPGFLENGSSGGNGNANITVYNLTVEASGTTTLAAGAGWLCKAYYGKGATGNYIVNCGASGDLPGDGSGAGGIVGSYAATTPGSELTLRGCSSSCQIGEREGGIVGSYGGAYEGSIACEECWTTGASVDIAAGGIFGEYAGYDGTASATKCYSTGTIAASAGGIFGGYAGGNGGNAYAVQSYSRGNIGANGGGIFATYAGASSGTTSATNCYSAGTITTSGTGIYGSNKAVGMETNCYAAGGSWSSTTANANLQGTPPSSVGAGTTWASLGVDEPYILIAMGYTPYSLTNIDTDTSELVQSYSVSVTAGAASAESISPDASGNDFIILKVAGGDEGSHGTITINAQTGQVSSTSSTVAGTYTLTVFSTGSYNVTTFLFTVTSPSGGTATVSCCSRTLDLKGADYVMRTQITAGNIMIGSTAPQRAPISYSDMLAMKMAYACKR